MFKDPETIKEMFNLIAAKYDLLNNIISFGMHKIVKNSAVKRIPKLQNSTALDLCCGTGDISKILSKRKDIQQVYGLDFSEKMIELAKKKNADKKIIYLLGDATNLEFENSFFDICTISFGLRNIENTKDCIQEISRVLKNGGYFMHIDFLKSQFFADIFFDKISPLLAKMFLKNAEAYKYLVKSKQNYYTNEELINIFEQNNLKVLKTYKYVGKAITIHICQKFS